MTFLKIEGVDNVRAVEGEIMRAAGNVGAKGAAVVRRTAHDIEARMKRTAPVDTGAMKNSVGVDFEGDGRFASFAAEIGPTVDYAPHVEFGTTRQAPQPFAFPAADAVEPSFIAALEKLADPFDGDTGG